MTNRWGSHYKPRRRADIVIPPVPPSTSTSSTPCEATHSTRSCSTPPSTKTVASSASVQIMQSGLYRWQCPGCRQLNILQLMLGTPLPEVTCRHCGKTYRAEVRL